MFVSATSKLLEPYQLGPLLLSNRVVLPPLTRNRASAEFVPTERMAVYYAQRASAGLMITEGVAISPEAVAYPRVPGLWNDEQVEGWRAVTSGVRASGSTLFAQLWHVGRVAHRANQPSGSTPVSSSPVPVAGEKIITAQGWLPFEAPRELSTSEVRTTVEDYARAAANALAAGFHGVEVHAANGYLIDQFLNDNVNHRTDRYGGDVRARVRFLAEVVSAVVDTVGADRVGVRLSPSGTWMQCDDSDRRALYTEAVRRLDDLGIVYLHLVEPTVAGPFTVEAAPDAIPSAYFRDLFSRTLVVAGDHDLVSGEDAVVSGRADLVGFGRAFIANPDLPERFATGAELAEANGKLYYVDGDAGYVDYPSVTSLALWEHVERQLGSGELSATSLLAGLEQRTPLERVAAGTDHTYLQLRRLVAGAPSSG